jgi:hypothetical protein
MTPEGAKTTPQIVSRTISQPSIQSVSQSASQSGGRAGRQGVGQSSVSQSVSQPVSLSASQPVSQSANRAVSQSIPNTLIPTRHSGEQAEGKWIYVCTETQKDFRENVYEAKLASHAHGASRQNNFRLKLIRFPISGHSVYIYIYIYINHATIFVSWVAPPLGSSQSGGLHPLQEK